MSDRDVIRKLAAVNPVPAGTLDGLVDQRSELLREDILRTPRVERRSSAPRRLVLAGAAVVVAGMAAAAVVVWPTGAEPAHAVTPQMLNYRPDGARASEVLHRLAELAERAPASPGGRYDYTQMQSYYLHSAARGDSRASAVEVVKEERWLAPDGSGRAVNVKGDLRVVGSDGAETANAVTYQGEPESDQRYGPGRLSGVADLSGLSTDPAVLAGQLAGNGTGFGWSDTAPNAPDWYRRIVVVTGIAKQQTVPPRLWAAMLRVLATTPELTSQGAVTDRAGRPALAVSVDTTYDGGRPSRLVLLFAPETGTFLGEEHILTTKFGDGPYDEYLRVRIPAVTEYRAVLVAGKVATDQDRLSVGGHK